MSQFQERQLQHQGEEEEEYDVAEEEQRPLVASSNKEYEERRPRGSESEGDNRYGIRIHMVEDLDPESVDFEPLVTSMNGAAMTAPLPKSKYSLDDNIGDESHGHDGFRHRLMAGGKMTSPSTEDVDDVHNRRPHSSYNLEDRQGGEKSSSEGVVRHFRKRLLSAPAKLRAMTLLLLPQRLSLFLADQDPSILSSVLICLSFFIVIVLVATASNTYRAFTGNHLLSSPYNNQGMFSSLASIRSGYLSRHSPGSAGHGGAGNNFISGRSNYKYMSPQGLGLAPPVGTRLPPALEVFANVDELPIELMDTAVYWHIPRSAGTTMKHILATCLGRVITTEMGGTAGHNLDERLDVIKQPHGMFVNVDTTTKTGLKHASDLGLAQSKMADVVFTPYVQEAAVLFQKKHRGRFFTIVRDPVDRIVSLYYYKRLATWEPNYNPKIADQTLEDFVLSYGENWMVRTLTGCMTGPLQMEHMNAAKEILRAKFLIGLLEHKTESLRRFEEYFGWKFPSPVSQTCKNNMFYFEWHSKNPHPPLDPANPILDKIRRMNMWDVELFEYARQLFQEQEVLFWKNNEEDQSLQEFVGNSQQQSNNNNNDQPITATSIDIYRSSNFKDKPNNNDNNIIINPIN